MKTTLTSIIFVAAFSGAALAGGISDPVVAPEVVAAEAAADSDKVGGLIAALAVILIIAGKGGL
jgi:hypothetical protein